MTLSHFQITAKTNIVIWVSIHMHFIYCYFSLKLQNYTNCEMTLCILTAFFLGLFRCQHDLAKMHVNSIFLIKGKQWNELTQTYNVYHHQE